MANDDALIREQIEYYRERAPEYDDWFYQRGRYDQGRQHLREWLTETARAHAILRSLGPVEDVLELAGGTGIWTERLLQVARRITSVDASPEVIEAARHRVSGDPRVTFETADVFSYAPAQRFDLISFTFWLSHVPTTRLPGFFALLKRSLRPRGVLFALDQRSTAGQRTRHDHLQKRDLADGRTYEIVKLYYTKPQLEALFAEHGFRVEVTTTPSLWVAVAHLDRHAGGWDQAPA